MSSTDPDGAAVPAGPPAAQPADRAAEHGSPTFASAPIGAVLCGGASSRMGRDKALLETPNGPLAAVVAAALGGAGCTAVVLVGGDGDALVEATGIPWLPDLAPGEGPLGGLATVAAHHPGRPVVVCACDLPWIRASDLAALIDPVRDGDAELAVAVVDGVPQWSAVALSARAATMVAGEFRSGERALHRAVAHSGLAVAHVVPQRPEALADVDRPEDLPGRWDVAGS